MRERLLLCLKVGLTALLAAGARDAWASDERSPPNILFILADDVGREVLQCYGGRSYRTPRIDRLAVGGMRFTHAYVMPVCHPTRVALLTGQYPFRLGNPGWGTFPQAAEHRTLGQVLKRAGYATAVAGKWQLALLKDDLKQPHRLGFDTYCLLGWHEGPWYYQPHIWQDGVLRRDVRDRYGPDVVCDFLIDFIQRNRDRPFFAYYPMTLCHDETNDLPQPAPLGPKGRYDTYAERVSAMDRQVGRLVDVLDALRLRERTLIVFLSDNGTPGETMTTVRDGQFVMEKLVSRWGDKLVTGGKAQFTDWGTRVPLIVNWPGTVASGQVNDALIDASDILPTLAEVAGARLPEDVRLDGRSFAPLIRGDKQQQREFAYIEYRGRSFIRDRRWKLYNDDEMFDLETDPDEQRPLLQANLSAAAADARDRLRRLRPHQPGKP